MQVLVTAVVVGLVAHIVCGQAGPAAIVIGNGLALSSTAVVLQVWTWYKYFLDIVAFSFIVLKHFHSWIINFYVCKLWYCCSS